MVEPRAAVQSNPLIFDFSLSTSLSLSNLASHSGGGTRLFKQDGDGWSPATWTRRPCCVSLGVRERDHPRAAPVRTHPVSDALEPSRLTRLVGCARKKPNTLDLRAEVARTLSSDLRKMVGYRIFDPPARIRRDERRSARLIRISVARKRIARRTINGFQRARRECGGLPRSSQASPESSDPSAQSARIRRRRYARSCTRRPRHCRPRPARFLSPE
jgi:hypothetical protein